MNTNLKTGSDSEPDAEKIILLLLALKTTTVHRAYLTFVCVCVFVAELEVSDSGMYTCTASSESGETSWSASLTVEESPGARLHRAPDPAMFPAAPSVPTIVNVTKNSVTVTWHPPTPHLGASPIIGYTLEYYSSDLQTGWVIAAHRISTNTMVVSVYTYM